MVDVEDVVDVGAGSGQDGALGIYRFREKLLLAGAK